MEHKDQRIIFLKGKKVILRPLNKGTDLENCLRWINDPGIIQYLDAFLPVSKKAEEEWFDNLGKRENDIILAIETVEGIYIGNVGLHKITWKDRTAIAGMAIGDKDYWGKSYGTDAAILLFGYAFNELNLRKICMDVFSFNERSWRHLEKCGCRKEGIQKQQIFKNGKYVDRVLMAVFKKDWQKAWKKYQQKSTTPL